MAGKKINALTNFGLSLFLCLLLLFTQVAPVATAADMTEAELEKWFYEDEPVPVQVDEGELVFLTETPEKPVLHSRSELTIDEHSINSGWTSIAQCYKHLDPITRTTVVYQYQAMRNLHIVSTQNIHQATIHNQSIELENVGKNAQLCIGAEAKIFNRMADDTFSLKNGPYHRKFLDGYFPYHVTLIIHYPQSKLEMIRTMPEQQPGFNINHDRNRVTFDSVFAGKLNIEAQFKQR